MTMVKAMLRASALLFLLFLSACQPIRLLPERESTGALPEAGSTEGMATDPVEIVEAFYAAMNGLQYEKAVTFLANDAVMINPTGTYTGTEANLAQITANFDAGIRVKLSSLRNVDGIVVCHVNVTENGDPIYEGDGGITIVEDGKITFDGDTFDTPQAEDPSSPIAIVKAFYVALDAKEYDRAITFVALDATFADDSGSHQGLHEITTHLTEAGDEARSYDIWEISEVDGTVSYKVRVYQDDTVIYETIGSAVVEDGKITMNSTAKQ
jgi:limonene-1,2-epoxide hydrolase